jgi:hypothetical protein
MFGSLRRALSSEELGGRVSKAGFIGQLFFAVALVALVISFFTTSKGFYNFFANDEYWWAIFIALGFGFVIQSVLAGSSWLLGQDLGQYVSRLKDHAPPGRSGAVTFLRIVVTLSMFLPALFLSIFLSFNTYFNSLYHGPEENRLQQARVPPFISEVIVDLKKQIDAARKAAVDGLNTQVLGSWLPKLTTVADEAAKAEQTIQQALKQEAEGLRKRIADQQLEQQKSEERRRSAERKKVEAKLILDQDLPKQIADAEKKREEFAEQLKGLQTKRDPVARRLYVVVRNPDGTTKRVKVARVARELAAIDRQLNEVKAGNQANDRNIKAWDEKNKKANTEHADAIGDLRTIENPGAINGPAPQPSPVNHSWHDVTTAVASLRNLKAELELKTAPKGAGGAEALYNAAVNTCNVLIKVLRSKPDTAKRVEGIACDPQVLGTIQQFDQQERFRKQFDTDCYSIDRNQPRTFDDALSDARKCRQIAQNGGMTDIVATNRIIREFEENFSTDRSQFSKTMSAFWLSFHMAVLALVASLVQDLVLLGASIFIEITRWQRRQEEMTEELVGDIDLTLHPGDDAAMQCAKVVIGNVTPTHDAPTLYAFDTDSDAFEKLTPGQQANVRNGLNGLMQQGLARVPSSSSVARSVYHLTSSGLFELRRILRSRVSAASEQKRAQTAYASGRRRPAGSPDVAEEPGRSDAPIRAMGLRLVQGGSDQPRRAAASSRGASSSAPRAFEVFTPAELWRLDRSSVVKRVSNGPSISWPPSAESATGSRSQHPDSGLGSQADETVSDWGSTEQNFSPDSSQANPRSDGYGNPRGDSYETSSGRGHAEQDMSRDPRRGGRMGDNRNEGVSHRAANTSRGGSAAGSTRGLSLDELRELEREERRR